MESTAYAIESRLEATHWWFRGRSRLFSSLIAQEHVGPSARVLEVVAGCGSNLRLLERLGMRSAIGVDRSVEAAGFAKAKGFAPVSVGDACALPFAQGIFDFVLLTDVIEHIDDDAAALKEAFAVLRPGGAALVTVPALRSLWGRQDEITHHLRRYKREELCAALTRAGFAIDDCFYFNFLLFPLIWSARKLLRLLDAQFDSENNLTHGALNAVLAEIFALDVSVCRRLRPPFGVSLCAWARKAA